MKFKKMGEVRNGMTIPAVKGDYNYPPANLCEISQEEWAKLFFLWHPKGQENRQICRDAEGKYVGGHTELQMWWQDEYSGIALSRTGDNQLIYHRFGCPHENTKELDQDECRTRGIYHSGRQYHVTECLECGYVHGVDSSG